MIMDYEKLHKDTINKLQEMVNSGKITVETARGICADFVPENEDERIRKAIIRYFQTGTGYTSFYGVSKNKILSYLEKQGKQKTVEEIAKEVCKDKASAVAFLKSAGIMNEKGELAEQYRQDEQKSIDKVEPKFKVGDWVVNTITKEVEQVIELTSCEYICSGHLIVSFNNYNLLKKWTIQDAKDGDVLCSNQMIVLFKQWEDNTDYSFVIAHAGIDISGKLQITNGHWLISNKSKPATKEQRDLLFQKMKEAGYEWNDEKKELKKIEYNSVWSEEDDIMIHDIDYALRCHITYPISKLQSMSTWINNLKNRIQSQNFTVTDTELAQAKKDAYNDALNKIEYHSGEPTFDDGWSAAIWYLKKKNAQPKQEWSEEDSYMLGQAIKCVSNSGKLDVSTEEIEYWLKSIVPQKQWKPSEDQMTALAEALSLAKNCGEDCSFDLRTLYEQLKKLREE